MVISKKRLTLWHFQRLNGLHNKISFFFFSYFTILSSTCGNNFGRTVARKSSIGHVCAGGAKHSENLGLIVNVYIKYFPANAHNRLV